MAKPMLTRQKVNGVLKKVFGASKITKSARSNYRVKNQCKVTKTGKHRQIIKVGEAQAGTGAQPSDVDGPHFHLFPKLPFEIRLKIWSLQAPSPRTLIQVKPPGYKPRHTFTEAQPAPAVMHVCRESRKEYLYRSDDEANNAERKTHALYGPIFSDDDGKVSFFSYEVDELHLMTFKVAEPGVRNNVQTIVIGPSHCLASLLLDNVWSPYNLPGSDVRGRIASIPSQSWYTSLPKREGGDWDLSSPYPEAVNNYTLVMSVRVMYGIHLFDKTLAKKGLSPSQCLAIKHRLNYRYDFRQLVKFPALRKLIVMVCSEETLPTDHKQHIVWKTLDIIKRSCPTFNIPEVEFRLAF